MLRLLVRSAVITFPFYVAACSSNAWLMAHPPAKGNLASAPVESPKRIEYPDPVEQNLVSVGPIYIAGQPSEAALRRMIGEGVTVVINLRTPKEMNDRQQVPHDEEALLKQLNVDYVYIPIGGKEYPASPTAVDEFAAALASHKGKALLHCTVAWRASHLWAAYLIRHRGIEPEKALADARSIVPGRPLFADFLNADIQLVPHEATE